MTNQAKALTFEGAFDFQSKLAKRNGIRFKDLDKTVKKDFTKNKLRKTRIKFLNLW